MPGYAGECLGPITVLAENIPFERLSLSKIEGSGVKTNLILRWENAAGELAASSSEKASLSLYSNASCSSRLVHSRIYSVSPKNGQNSISLSRPNGSVYVKAQSRNILSSCLDISTSTIAQCQNGFHLEGGSCVSNSKACIVQNGTGTQQWNGVNYGSCEVSSCDSGFYNSNGLTQNKCAQIPRIETSSLSSSTSMALSSSMTCAIINGGVKCWGFGRMGNGSADTLEMFPAQVNDLSSGVLKIVAGYNHICALLEDKTVKCWGRNNFGQIGDGTTITRNSPTTVVSSSTDSNALSGVLDLEAGFYHTCAVLESGQVTCWGKNGSGQLGLDNGTSGESQNSAISSSPVQPYVVDNVDSIKKLALGLNHSCALLKNSGKIKCWGYNGFGQLGYITQFGARIYPVPAFVKSDIPEPNSYSQNTIFNGASDITAGMSHTCALVSGSVKCWGGEHPYHVGRLSFGVGSTPSSVPAEVKDLFSGTTVLDSGVTQIKSGPQLTCALTSAGIVKCFGYDSASTNPNAFNKANSTIYTVSSLSGVSSIILTAGSDHYCSIANSKIYCWGDNNSAELADGYLQQYYSSPISTKLNSGNQELSLPVSSMIISGTCSVSGGTDPVHVGHNPRSSSMLNSDTICENGQYSLVLNKQLLDDIFLGVTAPNRKIKIFESVGQTDSPLSESSSIEWP